MEENDQINELQKRLDELSQVQHNLSREIATIKEQVTQLSRKNDSVFKPSERKPAPVAPVSSPQEQSQRRKASPDLERFIGENLISKLGILIMIIGVGIGAKYAVDHQLVSPTTRIILGYVLGAGLLGFAVKLKSRYESFSAVLVSGSLAIMYLLTYAASVYYGLLPKVPAFGAMIVLTIFAVFAAIKYSREVIAHIGLVGAYAVPFLLSDGSGEVSQLFIYMTIINAGILAISLLRYWKRLYYSAFSFTWLIFGAWYFQSFGLNSDFGLALSFCSVFFLLFYLTIILYKLICKEQFLKEDVILLLSNSFVFYGFGYALISQYSPQQSALGAFTVVNAVIHFAVSMMIFKRKQADANLFLLTFGLMLVFLTVAIPVQLNGNWVTLLWSGEALLLLWIGRTRSVTTYEKLSYPLIFLAFLSLLQDWDEAYSAVPGTLVLNVQFLSSLIVAGCFAAISYLYFKTGSRHPKVRDWIKYTMCYAVPSMTLIVFYGAFFYEISAYWNQQPTAAALWPLKHLWLINYTLIFLSGVTLLNAVNMKSEALAYGTMALSFIVFAVFLSEGMLSLTQLRTYYLEGDGNFYNLGIRYVSLGFAALLLAVNYYYLQRHRTKSLELPFDVLFYLSTLVVVSSELVHWLDLFGFKESYKLGMSILWGVIALGWIITGILQRKKYVRIGAIVLFAVTLVKLFLYDISHLSTLSKTVVFVALGLLLLIISFFYNKFKDLSPKEAV